MRRAPTAAGLALLMAMGLRAAGAQTPVPASGPATAPSATSAPFAGSASCRDCHAPFYEKWAGSHHGLAMQPVTAEFIRELKPQETPIAVRDRQYRVELSNGQGRVVEADPEGERKYALVHALGGKNVYYFLTPLERGRLQVLPLAFDVRRQEWFDTTGSAARGLINLRDEILDWRAPQLTFNTSCYGCHVSQVSTNYDAQTDSYHTVWAEPGINCETCHAAGGEHARLFRALPAGQTPADIRIISTKKFSIEQLNALCAPCHAKAMPLTAEFRPGDRYFDNYDLGTPDQTDFYPDGRDLGENYTYTAWRMSPCAKSGQLGCMHCHTSSGRYRFVDEPNAACLPCHRSQVENVAAHTHHEPDSTGSRCVACHMPTTEFARMRRSDHSMRPPMPAATLAYKSPNACNLCHTDQDAAWSDKYVREWRPRDYQAATLRVAALIDAARKRDWARLPDILAYLGQSDHDEVFAAALVRLLRACEDERKWPGLIQTLKVASPLVRAAAAEGLEGCPVPEALAGLLAATGDEYRLVRVRAAATLAALPPDRLTGQSRANLEQATREWLDVIKARPDDSAAHHNLGNFYMARRDYARAVECYERAVKLQPDQLAPLVNASLAHNAAGHNDRAEDCLRRALKVDPCNAAANLNLGLLLGEMGRTAEAETALRAALKTDPQSATAAYNLAVILAADRLDQAIELCRQAARLRPQEPKYAYTLAFYLRSRGELQEATATLERLIESEAASVEVFSLLGQLYEEQRRTAEAVRLYQLGAANTRFPAGVREQFAQRAGQLGTSP